MKKIYNQILLLSSAFGLMWKLTNVQAMECTLPPDCASLGYTKTEDDCKGNSSLKCPFDTNKVFCQREEKNLTKSCTIAGDILYGDGTCAISVDELDPNRTPIGVVFDAANHLAVALENKKYIKMAEADCDVPNLEYCTSKIEVLRTCALEGRSNTNAILKSTCTTPAADWVNLYQPEGCDADFCEQGKWFLPSIKELYTIFNLYESIENTLTALNKDRLYGGYSCSSNLYSNHYNWLLYVASSYDIGKYDNLSYYVIFNTCTARPVVKY